MMKHHHDMGSYTALYECHPLRRSPYVLHIVYAVR